MILFLDFDGVLHPVPSKDLFCYIPRLENILRKFPDVKVVISSMWRASHNLSELREFFSEDIRPRIIGVTPFVEEQIEDWLFTLCKTRHKEILSWIEQNNYKGPWVALDDAYQEFPEDCKELIRCETIFGFDEDAEFRLIKYLIDQKE